MARFSLGSWFLAALMAFAPYVLAQLPDPKPAGEELNKGASDYRAARYSDATKHFENAVRLDPSSHVAHLFLATAYAQQYIPGADAPENRNQSHR
jgi:Tfp pilus assembly protein PilF